MFAYFKFIFVVFKIRINKYLSEMAGSGEPIPEDNGFILNEILLPEELLQEILSYVDLETIFSCLLTCKKWNDILTSHHVWNQRCSRINKSSKRKLPWYAYYALLRGDFFDKNLLLNNCGQEGMKYWEVINNGGDGIQVENPPDGADPVPDQPEFNNNTMCFSTSFHVCAMKQVVRVRNRFHRKILDELKPTIYVSEW